MIVRKQRFELVLREGSKHYRVFDGQLEQVCEDVDVLPAPPRHVGGQMIQILTRVVADLRVRGGPPEQIVLRSTARNFERRRYALERPEVGSERKELGPRPVVALPDGGSYPAGRERRARRHEGQKCSQNDESCD